MMAQTWLEARFAESRVRAIAALTRQFRDLDLAEEAFSDACLRAMAAWPATGQPRDPFAWLLTTARNCGIDRIRKRQRQSNLAAGAEEDAFDPRTRMIAEIDNRGLRDDVLRMLFICCHPALDRRDQLALALKVVAGLKVPEIARALLVRPKAMEQRITRAKRKVGENPVPFEPPSLAERSRRLNAVMTMIYLLFNEGWSTSDSPMQMRLTLCEEAIRLARLLLELFPAQAELMGLLALMLLQHARRKARMDANDTLIPLEHQDRSLWDVGMMAEADILLQKAARHAAPGVYQLQAGIAACHAAAPDFARTDWNRIDHLYSTLYALQPNPVVRLNQAAVRARTAGPLAALAMTNEVAEALKDYRWLHSTQAAFYEALGDAESAAQAYRRALALGPTAPEKRYLEEKIAACEKN